MVLDEEIQGELNRRVSKWKRFKALRLKKEGLEELKQQDINWIKNLCDTRFYDPKFYLDYYKRGIG